MYTLHVTSQWQTQVNNNSVLISAFGNESEPETWSEDRAYTTVTYDIIIRICEVSPTQLFMAHSYCLDIEQSGTYFSHPLTYTVTPSTGMNLYNELSLQGQPCHHHLHICINTRANAE